VGRAQVLLMKTVTIIGAGSVGVACADAILHSGAAQRVSLFDMDAGKAEGEALDFAHVAPMLGHCQVDGGGMDQLAPGADICVITAGAKQRPGEGRLQLVDRNLEALESIATQLEARGLPRIALVVTNPVDVMTFALTKRWQAKGVAVLGTGTLLDSMRLRVTLARWLDVSGESVHAWVVGEHGDSSVPLLDSARVAGQPLPSYCERRGIRFSAQERRSFVDGVRGAAQEVIRKKGATCHAIGLVTARLVSALLSDEGVILPVSASVDGVCAGVPARIGHVGPQVLGWPELSTLERSQLDVSLSILREACSRVR
jgi:L-lactate dehydrogenase